VHNSGTSYIIALANPHGLPVPVPVFLLLSYLLGMLWLPVQANFVRRLTGDRQPLAMSSLGGFALCAAVACIRLADTHRGDTGMMWPVLLLLVSSPILYILGCFSVKAAMEEYYTNTEQIGLYMGGWMTWVFGTLYIQYHLSRIAKWKKTGKLKPQ
jgi:hypothetical protein